LPIGVSFQAANKLYQTETTRLPFRLSVKNRPRYRKPEVIFKYFQMTQNAHWKSFAAHNWQGSFSIIKIWGAEPHGMTSSGELTQLLRNLFGGSW